MIPATLGIVILHQPIIRTIFQRGEFGVYSTRITSWALLFYAFGLFAYSGIKTLAYTFYSLKDTLTPVKTAAVCLLINIALNLILMRPLKVGGLALATSIAATVNFFYLWRRLNKKIGVIGIAGFGLFFYKVLLAAGLMGLFCWWTYYNLNLAVLTNPVIRLISTVLISLLAYLVFGWLLNIAEIRKLCGAVLRKK
jgi:putative peptidoglycan lipid II flippase